MNITLKTPLSIGDRIAPNRMVHQPMECNDFLGGFPSELTLKRYRRLAEAKAGITVVECGGVLSSSKSRLHGFMADESHRSGVEKLTGEFKKVNQDTLLCYQLSHYAQRGDPRFSEAVSIHDSSGSDKAEGRILGTSEIKQIRDAFIKSAVIVHGSGADMVDVKLCHNHFGHQIIRQENKRPDEYGGNIENRMRFAREVIEGIKERIPDSKFKIMVRFEVSETLSESADPSRPGEERKAIENKTFDFGEQAEMLRLLVKYGVDILNITGGGFIMFKAPQGFQIDNPQSYSTHKPLFYAKQVKDLDLGIPVITSGLSVFGDKIPEVGRNAVLNGYADMVGVGRQILADPDIDRILAGNAEYCTRCGGCMELVEAQLPGGCTNYDPFYELLKQSIRLHKPGVSGRD